MKTSVIIILYKKFEDLTFSEQSALIKAMEVLGDKNHFSFVINPAIVIDNYKKLVSKHLSNYDVIILPEWFFYNINTYNKLMLHKEFYRKFISYDYILIYQLDCWVFKDDLNYWTSLGYDYIGAPFFKEFGENKDFQFITGGNGGFSLRKVKKHLSILESIYQLRETYYNTCREFSTNELHGLSLSIFQNYLVKYNFSSSDNIESLRILLSQNNLNEDYIWSVLIANNFKAYKVCPPKLAAHFSIEVHPRFLYEQNGNKLPMGTHAWQKYDRNFWNKYIEEHES